jgi:hypothetical protein
VRRKLTKLPLIIAAFLRLDFSDAIFIVIIASNACSAGHW